MSSAEHKQAGLDADWWRQFNRGDWKLHGFSGRDSADFHNDVTGRSVTVTGDYISFFSSDADWSKHKSAEEPGELYFNEVTGIGAMSDQCRIAELEGEVKQACCWGFGAGQASKTLTPKKGVWELYQKSIVHDGQTE